MTCGECKHLSEVKFGPRCYPPVPVWANDISRSRKPTDPADSCPCFERKEEK